jgi:hypothetical protein
MKRKTTETDNDSIQEDVLERLQAKHVSVRKKHALLMQQFLPDNIILLLVPMDLWMIICSYFPLLAGLIIHQDTKLLYTHRFLRSISSTRRMLRMILRPSTFINQYPRLCTMCCVLQPPIRSNIVNPQQLCRSCTKPLMWDRWDVNRLYREFKGTKRHLEPLLKPNTVPFGSRRVVYATTIRLAIERILQNPKTPKSTIPVLKALWCHVQQRYLAPDHASL